jgi:hypothetical protein
MWPAAQPRCPRMPIRFMTFGGCGDSTLVDDAGVREPPLIKDSEGEPDLFRLLHSIHTAGR